MLIGIPKEIKTNENRVGLTPSLVKSLIDLGHVVFVEKNAGLICGYTDEKYIKAGATILETAAEVYASSDMIVKIAAPQPAEYDFLKPKQILCSYLYLAHNKDLAAILLKKEITSIAYESVKKDNGIFPLLEPVYEIIGKLSVQLGARYLEYSPNFEGRGILLGGLVGIYPAHVCIIGADTIGFNAAKTAADSGACVCVLDFDLKKLKNISNRLSNSVKTLYANTQNIERSIAEADLLICAINSGNKKSQILVTEKIVKSMKKGAVIIDTELEHGSIVETMKKIKEAENPIIVKHGVLHYSSIDIQNLVARTASIALNNALFEYLPFIADKKALSNNLKQKNDLRKGVTTYKGDLTDRCVADELNFKFTEISLLIGI